MRRSDSMPAISPPPPHLYEQAVKLDPFSIDAAFQGVNSYLLNDRLPEAVGLLKAIRIRGTSAATKKANALLQELSVVSKEAGTELQAGIPQPPADRRDLQRRAFWRARLGCRRAASANLSGGFGQVDQGSDPGGTGAVIQVAQPVRCRLPTSIASRGWDRRFQRDLPCGTAAGGR